MKGMMRRLIDDFRNQGIGVAVIEAAVLIEADWVDLVDQVWVVTVPVEVAAARLIARNGLTPDQARARISAQLSNEERARQADVVIDNSGSVEQVRSRLAELWDGLVLAGSR
jgi:dephospho-CoA kinase